LARRRQKEADEGIATTLIGTAMRDFVEHNSAALLRPPDPA
jgi:hypothetical protein